MESTNKLTIALDYDDTFTADPDLFRRVVNWSAINGHTVYCVTARQDTEANRNEIREAFGCRIDTIMTNGNPKMLHCQAEGIEIDVWIDDSPHAIIGNDDERLKAAWDEVYRLQELVIEASLGRDMAEQKAKESCQAEMSALRIELATCQAELRRVRSGSPI